MLETIIKSNVQIEGDNIIINEDIKEKKDQIINLDDDKSNKDDHTDKDKDKDKGSEPAKLTPEQRAEAINKLPEDIETFDITTVKLEELDSVIVDNGDEKLEGFRTADGHIINKDGKVILTARQVYEMENTDDSAPEDNGELTIENISKLSGITLVDETGKPLEFEATPAGFAAREAKIQEIAINKGKKEALIEFFNQHEDLKDIYLFKSKHGTVENYKPSTDLINTKLVKEETDKLEQIIIQAQIAKGDTQDKAQRFVNYSKSDNKLYEDAIEAQTYLKAKQQAEIDTKIAADKEKAEQYYGFTYEGDKEVVIDNEGSLYNKIITKGKIGDFKIPETGIKVKQEDGSIKQFSKRDILYYIALSADENGNSQAEIDFQNRINKPDEKLLLYLTTLMHGDLSQLSNELVKQDRITKAKSIITTTKKNVSSSNTGDTNKIIKFNLPVK